jgi:hypothetical protein
MTDSATRHKQLHYLIAEVVNYDALHVPINPETDPHMLIEIYSTYVHPLDLLLVLPCSYSHWMNAPYCPKCGYNERTKVQYTMNDNSTHLLCGDCIYKYGSLPESPKWTEIWNEILINRSSVISPLAQAIIIFRTEKTLDKSDKLDEIINMTKVVLESLISLQKSMNQHDFIVFVANIVYFVAKTQISLPKQKRAGLICLAIFTALTPENLKLLRECLAFYHHSPMEMFLFTIYYNVFIKSEDDKSTESEWTTVVKSKKH